ncbi:MAG: histidine kinase [Crocinitomicaceae bacterium]|nr:histidine kinase [Crocinitomicaceae bacterium]
MKFWIALILLFISTVLNQAYGQNVYFRNYDISDGLPSSEVHDIYEDAKGFIWFATDRGIVRYDGEQFVTFNEENGLKNIVIFNFYEESYDKVWISNVNNELYSFNPFSFPLRFEPFPYNDSLKIRFQELRWSNHIRQFWKDEGGNFNFSFLINPGRIVISPDGKTEIKNWTLLSWESGYLEDINYHDILVHVSLDPLDKYLYTELVIDTLDAGDIIVFDERSEEKIWVDQKYRVDIRAFEGITDYLYTKEGVRFLIGTKLIIYENGSLKTIDVGANGLRIRIWNDKMYVATTRGCNIYTKSGTYLETMLPGQWCTDVHMDRLGGLWVSTAKEGVFYSANPKIRLYGNANEKMIFNHIELNDQFLLLKSWDEVLWVYDKRFGVPKKYKNVTFWSDVYLHYHNEEKLSYIFGKNGTTPFSGSANDPYSFLYFSLSWDEKKDVFTAKKALYVFEETHAYHREFKNCAKVYDQVRLGHDSLYLATEEGLYVSDLEGNTKVVGEKNELLRSKMKQIEWFQEGLLMSTYVNGMVYYKSGKVFSISTSNGLSSSSVSRFRVQDDSIIWIATNKGLDKVVLDEDQNIKGIYNANEIKGLPSNEVTTVEVHKDTIWVATKKGLLYFPSTTDFGQNVLRKDLFSIDSVRINKTKSYFKNEFVMQEKDVLEIYFTQISYSATNDITYQYRIPELDLQWSVLDAGYLRIANMVNGSYSVQIKSAYETENGPIITIPFKVHTPWWKTWWAIVLYIILGLGLIGLVFKLLLIRIDRKRRGQLEKVQLELKVLISQMNPHFTFNTINSIQHYIIENESKLALNYLADFALLIRKSLDYSRQEYITLEEEVEFLQLYVGLESKRFGKEIRLEVDLKTIHDPAIIAFPALLLQPVIENAIIHGLQPLEKMGVVKLFIKDAGEYFEIEIHDNGVGLSGKVKSNNHKSHGLDILKSRINLYNSTHKKSDDVQIINNPKGEGTIVKIKLYKARYIE